MGPHDIVCRLPPSSWSAHLKPRIKQELNALQQIWRWPRARMIARNLKIICIIWQKTFSKLTRKPIKMMINLHEILCLVIPPQSNLTARWTTEQEEILNFIRPRLFWVSKNWNLISLCRQNQNICSFSFRGLQFYKHADGKFMQLVWLFVFLLPPSIVRGGERKQ